jgi:hypothetical protein
MCLTGRRHTRQALAERRLLAERVASTDSVSLVRALSGSTFDPAAKLSAKKAIGGRYALRN